MSPVLKYKVGESAFPESAKMPLVDTFVAGAILFFKILSMLGCCDDLSRRFVLSRRVEQMNITHPNQAPEPTTPAVTIPAAQEVAPAAVVAHL